MSRLKFITHIIFFAALTSLGGISINYVIDPYSVFKTPFFPEFGQPQERYLKIEYLKENKKFNTFLIGSSRIGVIKTEDVNDAFFHSKTYNLTISQANQWDIEKHVEWLVNNIPDLSHILVQIDWPTEFGPDRPAYKLMDEVHPDISGRPKIDFLLDYLTFFNLEGLKVKLSNNFGGIDLLKYDMTKGYWSRPLLDNRIERDCQQYIRIEKSFNSKEGEISTDAEIIDNSLASIKKYRDLLAKRNIKLTVFLTPLNHHLLDKINIVDYNNFLRTLSGITDFYNFMYYSQLTQNDCNYYETSHYRPTVSALIVQSLSGHNVLKSAVHHFVSKSDIEPHLNFLQQNFSEARLK